MEILIATWREAELFAQEHMRDLGFGDAEATPLGVDGGLDVVSGEAAAQVKHYATSPVGAPAVQQLRGAAHGFKHPIFYALSGFTAAAVAYADSAGVALFQYSPDGAVRALSSMGEALSSSERGRLRPGIGRATAARERMLREIAEYVQATLDTMSAVLDEAAKRIQPTDFQALPEEEPALYREMLAFEDYFSSELLPRMQRGTPGSVLAATAETEGFLQRVAEHFGIDYQRMVKQAMVARADRPFRPSARQVDQADLLDP